MIRIAVLGIVITILGLELKQVKNEYAGLISLAGCVVIFSSICANLSNIIADFLGLLGELGIQSGYLSSLIKMLGTAYLAEFACGVCKDAGFSALSSQIEIFAKLYILTISLPIMTALLETVGGLWS
jgi:stage III sporulation protein AD